YKQFRTCCDFINVLFVIDEISDGQNGKDARATGQISINAMRDPDFDDGSTLCKITKDFRERHMNTMGPNAARRFLDQFDEYIECVSKEAELREQDEVLDFASFINIRRGNSAVRLCFELIEQALGLDLPQEVVSDLTFMEAYWAAVDMVWLSNDLYSYDMEQSKGLDGVNFITVFMKENNIDLQAASDCVGSYFKQLMDRHVDARKRLPSWGPEIDADVARWLAAMIRWVRGNLDWSFESQRYFGPSFLEVKETGVVHLRPRYSEEPETGSGSDSE
ncbi:isoprenoid synthase domain-containing protein, partial [Lentinula raphanica]